MTAVDRSERVFINRNTAIALPEAASDREPLAFHQRLTGYAPTPLREAPGIAHDLGLDQLWIKDESERMGLPAFKILGASWAVFRAIRQKLSKHDDAASELFDWQTLDDLARQLDPLKPLTLTCATDGNHGRAVARMARLLGLGAHIFVPSDMAPARQAAIASEGARVTVIDGTYDDAVARSAQEADDRSLVISDTSWPGYEDVPRWVIEGYSTIFWEVEDELRRRGEPGPDLVAVQIGVGALAAAVVRHFRSPDVQPKPFILGVEPTHAACVLASMEAGEIVQIPGPHDSIMSGLNCGLPSAIAWPLVSRGIGAYVAIEDERAREAMRALAREGIVAGECGAAGLAGLTAWLRSFGGAGTGRRALVISTEGATDPEAYRQIVP
ncbi:MAG: diaminopropionate ammonia-lyase [Thermomicrobiales bacterium]|jgi:diaminopropionate ammonia-lyase|nr:diaminopropionate ammonia-lyase [Thermomicrobiales bacterium]